MEKLARSAPPNYRHKHHLVEAERLRVLDGNPDTIMHHYDQAIALARESEFIHEEALANELAARYLLNQGQNDDARAYLRSAMEQYEAWGAKRKVAHLKSRYPGLIIDDRAEAGVSFGQLGSRDDAQSLGSHLQYPRVGTTAGNPAWHSHRKCRGSDSSPDSGNRRVSLSSLPAGVPNKSNVFYPLSLPVEKAESLSLSVISWVKQTREHLVLDNASREERFAEDDYIKRERPKSILCAPITHQSALSGIIYLENNLVEGAFTSRRFEVVKHLSSQIAISLENARLHENLKKAMDELKASEISLREENVRLKANIKERYSVRKDHRQKPRDAGDL